MPSTSATVQAHIDYVVIPPDSAWGWFVVFVAFFSNMIVDSTSYSFGLVLDEMKSDFQVSAAFLSLASSLQCGLYFLLGPLNAAIINRFGFRVASITGATLAFAGVLSSAYLRNVYAFIGTFGGVLGIAFSMTYLSNVLVVGFYFSKYRAIATCIAVTGTAIGVSLVPIVFSVVLAEFGWRDKYKYLSGVHLLMALLSLVYKPVPASQIITEPTQDTPTWEEYEQGYSRNTDYPTNADHLQNQEYVIITPFDVLANSQNSFRSTRSLRLTSMSTMASAEPPKFVKRKCCCCVCSCKYVMCRCLLHNHRPMYRDDILFHGSTRSLPQYDRSQRDKARANVSYNMAVTRTSTFIDLHGNADCCNCCPPSVTRVLNTMLDMSLMKSLAFFLLCLSGFLSYLGIYVPYIYGTQIAIAKNVPPDRARYMLTAMGLANALGRIISGLFTLIPRANAMLITQVTLVIAGAAVAAQPFLHTFPTHVTCICIFGVNIATVSSLRTIVVVDMLGLEKLTNAFGLIVMMEGLSSFIALPINSFLYERDQDFVHPCLFSGFMIMLSGLILIPVVPLYRRECRRAGKKDKQKISPGSARRQATS